MKVKKIKERIEMSLKLLESLESLTRSDECLSLDVSPKRRWLLLIRRLNSSRKRLLS